MTNALLDWISENVEILCRNIVVLVISSFLSVFTEAFKFVLAMMVVFGIGYLIFLFAPIEDNNTKEKDSAKESAEASKKINEDSNTKQKDSPKESAEAPKKQQVDLNETYISEFNDSNPLNYGNAELYDIEDDTLNTTVIESALQDGEVAVIVYTSPEEQAFVESIAEQPNRNENETN